MTQTPTLTTLVSKVINQKSTYELYLINSEEIATFENDYELVTHLNRFCRDRIAWIEHFDNLIEVYLVQPE